MKTIVKDFPEEFKEEVFSKLREETIIKMNKFLTNFEDQNYSSVATKDIHFFEDSLKELASLDNETDLKLSEYQKKKDELIKNKLEELPKKPLEDLNEKDFQFIFQIDKIFSDLTTPPLEIILPKMKEKLSNLENEMQSLIQAKKYNEMINVLEVIKKNESEIRFLQTIEISPQDNNSQIKSDLKKLCSSDLLNFPLLQNKLKKEIEQTTSEMQKLWSLSEFDQLEEKLKEIKDVKILKSFIPTDQMLNQLIQPLIGNIDNCQKEIDRLVEETLHFCGSTFLSKEDDLKKINNLLKKMHTTEVCLKTFDPNTKNRMVAILHKIEEKISEKANKAKKLTDIIEQASSLVDLQAISSNIVLTEEFCKKKMDEIINCFKKSNKDLFTLGQELELEEYGIFGQEILFFFKQFKSISVGKFLEVTGRMDEKYALDNIEGDSLKSNDEIEELKKINDKKSFPKYPQTHRFEYDPVRVLLLERYKEYNNKYEQLFTQHFKNSNKLEDIVSSAKNETKGIDFNPKNWNSKICDKIPSLLAHVFIAWTFLNSDLENDKKILMKPHPIQVFSIFRILGLDTFAPSNFQKFTQFVGLSNKKELENHLIQIGTGEGFLKTFLYYNT